MAGFPAFSPACPPGTLVPGAELEPSETARKPITQAPKQFAPRFIARGHFHDPGGVLRPHQRVARGMADVPQGQQSFGQLSVMENLQLVADGRKHAAGRVGEALDMFPALEPLLARRAGLLSGGQRQQLAIARALITDPRLLILDEPTEGIQPNVVAEIESTIVKLSQRDGMSILLVEQHIGFALQAADSYYVLSAGRVSSAGPGGAGSAAGVRQAMLI
jgi:urea transport system ATP-binding protein